VVDGSAGMVRSRGSSGQAKAAKTCSGELRKPREAARVFALLRRSMAQIDRYTCEETIRRLDDYLDRELTPHEMQLVQEHLELCALCASEYAFEASALERVRDKLQRLPAPAELLARVSRALEGARGETPSQ
jgi:anti-sigma factor (TIGR02949 family)